MWHLFLCHQPVTKVLCLSKGEDDAAELLDKSRFINSRMPNWLQLKVDHDGYRLLSFKDTHAEILALPSTEDAGAGYTATHSTRDELDLHKNAEENFGNISPTIDAGASDLAMSTSKRIRPVSHFKTLYRNAKAGINGYYPMFFPWYVVPTRTAEWYMTTRKKYYPLYLFEQAYPNTEEEALSSVEGLGLFEKEALENLLDSCVDPMRIPGAGRFIFHPWRSDCLYYAGGDAAEGRGGDYSVIWIEGTNGIKRWLAALLYTNLMTPDIFGLNACDLLRQYGSPLLVMGGDSWGQQVLGTMVNLGYEHIYNTEHKPGKLGYIENESNKQANLQKFSYAVRDGLIVEHRESIEQMFGWNIDKGKYVSVMPHDDLVTAGAKANVAMSLADASGEVDVQHFG